MTVPLLPPLLCVRCLNGQCVHFWRGMSDGWTGETHTIAAVAIYQGDSFCADCMHAKDMP